MAWIDVLLLEKFYRKEEYVVVWFFFLSVGELLFMENSERIGNIELRSFSYFDVDLMMVYIITRTLLLNNLLIGDIDNRWVTSCSFEISLVQFCNFYVTQGKFCL